MGRQAYLTRIAFGRSAFEPPSEAEIARFASVAQPTADPSRTEYTQLYNERGHPINPRARQYGRQLRTAQNDVLAAIGVVTRSSPSEDAAALKEKRDRLDKLDDEDTAGNVIALITTLTENACIWWIGSLRYRIMTLDFPDSLSFSEILISELHSSGSSIIFAGFPARLLATFAVQAFVYTVVVSRPFDRFLLWTGVSRKTRVWLQRFKLPLDMCLRSIAEVAVYPFIYHASLQRLGIIPAMPLFPSWRAFVPFSSASPLRHDSISTALSAPLVMQAWRQLTGSPLLSLCTERWWDRKFYGAINEAIQSSIIQPDNPDGQSRDEVFETRASLVLGLRKQSPWFLRSPIKLLLASLGWANRDTHTNSPSQQDRHADTDEGFQAGFDFSEEFEAMDSTQSQTTRPTPAEQGVLEGGESIAPQPPQSPADAAVRPVSPISATASIEGDHEDDDARVGPQVRITDREGVVQMEVRLPPQLWLDVTGNVPSNTLNSNGEDVSSRVGHNQRGTAPSLYHVTHLSSEPANMLGEAVKAQLVTWAILPLKLITLRLIASHYLANHPSALGALRGRRVLGVSGDLRQLSLRSAGIFLSRIALCGALELALDLGLWGVQVAAVSWTGTRYFGWGSL